MVAMFHFLLIVLLVAPVTATKSDEELRQECVQEILACKRDFVCADNIGALGNGQQPSKKLAENKAFVDLVFCMKADGLNVVPKQNDDTPCLEQLQACMQSNACRRELKTLDGVPEEDGYKMIKTMSAELQTWIACHKAATGGAEEMKQLAQAVKDQLASDDDDKSDDDTTVIGGDTADDDEDDYDDDVPGESDIKLTFDGLDKDKDGLLTRKEMADLLDGMGVGVQESTTYNMLKELDSDGDELLTFREFKSVADDARNKQKKRRKSSGKKKKNKKKDKKKDRKKRKVINEHEERQIRDIFDEFDVDKDGSLDDDEIEEFMKESQLDRDSDAQAALMDKVDLDRDGRMDYSEFKALAREAKNEMKKSGKKKQREKDRKKKKNGKKRRNKKTEL